MSVCDLLADRSRQAAASFRQAHANFKHIGAVRAEDIGVVLRSIEAVKGADVG